jgi:hypothetical protein
VPSAAAGTGLGNCTVTYKNSALTLNPATSKIRQSFLYAILLALIGRPI